MPQMKPIYWLNLYISFSFIILIYIVMNFYNLLFLKSNNVNSSKYLIKNMSWKW